MERLDLLLVKKGYFNSRTKAQNYIKDGHVKVNSKVIYKPSERVLVDSVISVTEKEIDFVSRGGFKLLKAINEFNLDFSNKVVVDIGSSTGGFTDCALQHNAEYIYSIDVGTAQLDNSLKNDNRICLMENTNFLDILKFDKKIDLVTIDVSFTSVDNILKHLYNIINYEINVIVLIKPQFEIGKQYIKNGIVKDKKIHKKVLNAKLVFINQLGLNVSNITYSPIKGGSGNIEFIFLLNKNKNVIKNTIDEIIEQAHSKL